MSLSESGRHSREFVLKAVEQLETGERARERLRSS